MATKENTEDSPRGLINNKEQPAIANTSDEDSIDEPWFSEVSAGLDPLSDPSKSSHGDEKKAPAATGLKAEALDLYEGPEKCRCCINWVREHPDDVKESLEATDEIRQHAVLVRRKKSHQKYSREPLEIDSVVVHSPLIKKCLSLVLENYPGLALGSDHLTFLAPFQPLFHRWHEFENAIKQEGKSEVAAHLKILHDTLAPELEEPSRLSRALVNQGLINFELVWTLFKPGELIYCPLSMGDDEHLLRLDSSTYLTQNDEKFAHELTCSLIDWDGKEFGYNVKTFTIQFFDGTKSIHDLSVYPLEYHESIDEIKTTCLKRGRRFEELAEIRFVAYRGLAKRRRTIQNITDYTTDSLLDERIIIDADTYFRTGSNKLCLRPLNAVSVKPRLPSYRSQGSDYDEAEEINAMLNDHRSASMVVRRDDQAEENKQALTDDQCLICSPWVKGYALKSKQWTAFLVKNVRAISWNQDAFDHLVLPQGYKDLILGFVQGQLTNSKDFDDLIDGKGRGLTLLLTGPPGVGKTLTAEAVAEKLEAPLYSVSAGQLGLDVSEVEESLLDMLQLTKRWNAVLLLDEGDVFLAQRTIHDLERNRLVSVFLRTLEYFDGVLFLTTNRLKDFDNAFESRIDFNIEYPELDFESRLQVWKNLISRLKRPVDISSSDLEKLAQIEMNGRRVKNVIKSAQLIAAGDNGSAVRISHVETVLKVVSTKSMV